ncbi:MAG: hydrogenase nickel incorporation protein HypA [Xanthomonadales bacterium]|nr:hydrogenase maturation nickel metallochaperone HypA [Xanthomonadales bacterium]NIX13064.1 hydrogenase nickel incorporation protein HypA [Xanthomonadales bacterium]
MHELAVCQQLLNQVERLAVDRDATAVDRIVVSVGPLSGVEPHLLTQAFSVARSGTLAQHAELEVQTGPIKTRCRSCGTESQASASRLLCQSCGGWQVDVLEGTELMLMTVELSGLPATPRHHETEHEAGHARGVQ